MKLNLKKPLNEYFPSEALLQQAIVGLLVRMPNVSGVQILQGVQEYGKDIVFYLRGGFGESYLCACVIKNTKVTGEAGKPSGARTVFQQAQQAFDTPHVDVSGKRINVERVYVITPFAISAPTISSIEGLLTQRAGQVRFIGGTELLDLFKEHWPDFFADEVDALNRHLTQIREGMNKNDALMGISSLYGFGNTIPSVKKVYVPQTFYREIQSYTLGPTLTDPILSQEVLYRELTRAGLSEILSKLFRLGEALDFLAEWGYYKNDDANRQGRITRSLISDFILELESDWRKTFERVSKRLGPQSKDIPVTLANPPRLSLLLKSIRTGKQVVVLSLAKALEDLDSVVTNCNYAGVSALVEEAFIAACNLDDCAHCAPVGLFLPLNKTRVDFPKNLLSTLKGHLLIVGAPGYGKTSFCRWNLFEDVDRFNSTESMILPVYVPLHTLKADPSSSFEELFLSNLGRSALLPADEEQSDTGLRVRVYLDGLDEVSSKADRQQIIEKARDGVKSVDKYQIILTARDYVYGSWLDWLPRVSLGRFETEDILNLSMKWLDNKDDCQEFHDQLQRVPTLSKLMHTPLLATIIILVFRQTRRLPENRTKLYDIFVALHCGGWNLAKGVLRESKFWQQEKITILQNLSALVHWRRQKQFDEDDINAAIEETQQGIPREQWAALGNELLEDGLIIRSEKGLQFSHLSFQEFLAAKELLLSPQLSRISQVLDSILQGQNWWKGSWGFYVGLFGKPRELAKWVITQMTRHSGTRYNITVQSHVDDIWRAFVEAFPDFPLDKLVKEDIEHLNYSFNIAELKKSLFLETD